MPPAPGGREDPRGRQAGHRDLVRGAQVEAPVDVVVARAAEDTAEERDVGPEREHVEADRDRDPVPDGLIEVADRLVGAHDLGEQHIDRHDQQDARARSPRRSCGGPGAAPGSGLPRAPRPRSRSSSSCSTRRRSSAAISRPAAPVDARRPRSSGSPAPRAERPARFPPPAPARRAGRPRSARRGRPARSRASARRPSPPRRAPPTWERIRAAITEVPKWREGMAAKGLPWSEW